MFEDVTIGDRIKLEHIKSKSFIDSVVTNFHETGSWIEIAGPVTIWHTDGWEIVS